jgi:chemotaxis protein methyltransferase CheR
VDGGGSMMDAVLRERLRQLATERLGLAATSLQDVRVDAALESIASGTHTPGESLEALTALTCDEPAWQSIIGALVVGETSFFRQMPWFLQLQRYAIEPLVDAARDTGSRRLRIWSAACATGEEAYTIAIVLDRLLQRTAGWDIRILGTDINAGFIAAARRARYRAWSLRELDDETRTRYFNEVEPGRFELAAKIRDMVTFETLNLVDGQPDGGPDVSGADLIVCRNLLMYMSAQNQQTVAGRLAANLAPGGWLAVAPVEAEAEWFRMLARVSVPSAIFFRREPRPQRAG